MVKDLSKTVVTTMVALLLITSIFGTWMALNSDSDIFTIEGPLGGILKIHVSHGSAPSIDVGAGSLTLDIKRGG